MAVVYVRCYADDVQEGVDSGTLPPRVPMIVNVSLRSFRSWNASLTFCWIRLLYAVSL